MVWKENHKEELKKIEEDIQKRKPDIVCIEGLPRGFGNLGVNY